MAMRGHRARRGRLRQRRQRAEPVHRAQERASRRRGTASILPGITRDTIVTIARSLGYEVREELLPRETLYLADEAFFTGTAVEITPIRSIDKIVVGNGQKGPVTDAIHRRFFEIINGEAPDTHGWLSWVYPEEARAPERHDGGGGEANGSRLQATAHESRRVAGWTRVSGRAARPSACVCTSTTS